LSIMSSMELLALSSIKKLSMVKKSTSIRI